MEITGRAVRAHQRQPPGAARQCAFDKSAGVERDSVCGGTRLQVAWTSETIWPLAHDLYAHEPVGQKRRIGRRVRTTATGADWARPDRSVFSGLHFGESSSGWNRRFKKNGPQAIGKSRGGWNTKIHMVAADARTAIAFALYPGHDHDAPHGRALLEELGPMPEGLPLLMDRAYEGNETRQLVLDLGMIPVVPPKSNRLYPWEYDRALYKKRNKIERLFRRLKGFRRIFSRFEKLDVIFLAFLSFALIVEALRLV